MSNVVWLDHVEIHVDDTAAYGRFLLRLFGGGGFHVMDPSGTSMFVTDQGARFEIKKRAVASPPTRSGVCLPCICTADPAGHIEALGLSVDDVGMSPEGEVYFFTDPQGIQWHAKSKPAEVPDTTDE